MGGGDDAHIDLDRRKTTDPVELAIGKHAQQPRLEFGGHVADLVEEKRAPIGLLETSLATGLRAGKGAALVAEEFRLHQIARDRGHVQRNKRRARPGTVPVQCTCDQFLAGPGFPIDQHGDVGAGEATDGAEHLLHRRRLADDVRAVLQRRGGGIALLLLMATGATHLVDGVVEIERLGEVFEGPAMERGDSAVEIRVRGHDNDRQVRIAGRNLLQQVQPIDAWHPNIGQDHVWQIAMQCIHDADAVGKAGHIHVGLPKGALEHPTNGPIVIDDPNPWNFSHRRAPTAGRRRIESCLVDSRIQSGRRVD